MAVNFTADNQDNNLFTSTAEEEAAMTEPDVADKPVVFINILKVLGILAGIAVLIFIVFLIRAFLKNYDFSHKNNRRTWRRNRKGHRKSVKRINKFRDYDF